MTPENVFAMLPGCGCAGTWLMKIDDLTSAWTCASISSTADIAAASFFASRERTTMLVLGRCRRRTDSCR